MILPWQITKFPENLGSLSGSLQPATAAAQLLPHARCMWQVCAKAEALGSPLQLTSEIDILVDFTARLAGKFAFQ